MRGGPGGDQTVARCAKEHGISEQTRYRWKSKYSRMMLPRSASAELEKENARLKRIVASGILKLTRMKEVLKDFDSRPRRQPARQLCNHGVTDAAELTSWPDQPSGFSYEPRNGMNSEMIATSKSISRKHRGRQPPAYRACVGTGLSSTTRRSSGSGVKRADLPVKRLNVRRGKGLERPMVPDPSQSCLGL